MFSNLPSMMSFFHVVKFDSRGLFIHARDNFCSNDSCGFSYYHEQSS